MDSDSILNNDIMYDENKSVDSYEVIENDDDNCEVLSDFSDCCHLDQIPQTDGPNDMTPLPQSDGVSFNFMTSFARPTENTRKNTYTLDRNKQVKNLLKDANNDKDVDIVVSPSNENVNLHCNLGFYTKVAVPAFERLAAGNTTYVDNVAVICHDITKRSDNTGAATTTVIMYRLYRQNVSIGQVTIHLHHTKRMVQVQGGALISDDLKAPVWFVEKVLSERFNQLAKSQSLDIILFNRSVAEMVTKHLGQNQDKNKSICAGCNLPFIGRSTPEQCPQCLKLFHKSKCFPNSSHACQFKKRSRICITNINTDSSVLSVRAGPSNEPPISTSIVTLPHNTPPTVSTTASLLLCASTTENYPGTGSSPISALSVHVPGGTGASSCPSAQTPPSPTTRVTAPSPHSFQNQDTSAPSSILDTSTSGIAIPSVPGPSYLDPNAASFVSYRLSQEVDKNNANKSKARKGAPKTNNDVSIDLTKYQINVTQAKLKEQETTIKDLRFKNNILESRVADLEKKQRDDIYEKYFPKPNSNASENHQNTDQRKYSCGTSQQNISCCRHIPLGCQIICDSAKHTDNASNEVLKGLAALKDDIENVKNRLDAAINTTLPKLVEEALTRCNPSTAAGRTHSLPSCDYTGVTQNTEESPNLADSSHTTLDDAMGDVSGHEISGLEITGHGDHNHLN